MATDIEMGRADDPQEREADRVAEQASRSAASGSPPRPPSATPGTGQGVAPPVVHEVLGSSGAPLEGTTRAMFEARLGCDLSDVRVHRDAGANRSAGAVDAAAYTVGADIVFGGGRYAPDTGAGRLLIAHELAHVLQQRKAATGVAPRLARQDAATATLSKAADELVDSFSGLVTVDTAALGDELRRRAALGERDLVAAVLDSLSFFNRHWVAVAFAGQGSEAELEWLGQTPEGRAVLGLVLDGATRYWVGQAETEASERITTALVASRAPATVEQEILNTMVFPFKLPGLTVTAPAGLSAEQRPGGRVSISQDAVVFYSGAYPDEVATLPMEVFQAGLVIPADQIVGIRMYDLGGQVIYKPAAFLLQLSNATTTQVLESMVTTAGFALGGMGAAAEGGAGVLATALVWADRLALGLQAMTTVLTDHRGWIIEKGGAWGEALLRCVDMVNSALALYGGARALLGMGELLLALRRAIVDWRAGTALVESGFSAGDLALAGQVDDEASAIANQIDELQRAQGTGGDAMPAATTEPAAAVAEPVVTGPAEATPPVATRRRTFPCFVAGTAVLTPDGAVAIESLGVGDRVVACDPRSGALRISAVAEVYESQAPWVMAVHLGSTTIEVTREHPFWVHGGGWRAAGELRVGTMLQSRSSGEVEVTAIDRRDRPTTVYNLTVTGVGTYFVSHLGVLVHNKGGGTLAPPSEAELPAAKATAQAWLRDAEAQAADLAQRARAIRDEGTAAQAEWFQGELRNVHDSIGGTSNPEDFWLDEQWGESTIVQLRELSEQFSRPAEAIPSAGAAEVPIAAGPMVEAPPPVELVPEPPVVEAPPPVELVPESPMVEAPPVEVVPEPPMVEAPPVEAPPVGPAPVEEPIGAKPPAAQPQRVEEPAAEKAPVEPAAPEPTPMTARRVTPADFADGREVDPTEVQVFKGGRDLTVKPTDPKVDKATGLLATTHGTSTNVDPTDKFVVKYGGPQQIRSIPPDLKIQQRGRPGHCEIMPRVQMSFARYQELMNQVVFW